MRTVYKYSLEVQDNVAVEMKRGADTLHFAMQGGSPTIWALVNPDAPLETRVFRLAGTGHPLELPETLDYIGTTFDGPFVWHLFERERPPTGR